MVNSQDLAGIRNEWLGVNGAKPTIFGDIIGDGTVNVADYNAERLLIGTSLPAVERRIARRGPGDARRTALVRTGTSWPGTAAAVRRAQARPRAEIQLVRRED